MVGPPLSKGMHMLNLSRAIKVSAAALALFAVTQTTRAELIYGYGSQNNGALSLFSFDSDSPSTISALTPITGITSGFALVGIDFRNPFNGNPNGQLYGLAYDGSNNSTAQGQLYVIDVNSGVATPVGSPITIGSALGATGQSFGFAFNPTVDRIRVVTGNGSNFRMNPNDGSLVAFDTPVEYAAGDPNAGEVPQITAVDYQGGTLYDIDMALNVLVRQDPPNAGTLVTVGDLGITTLGANTMGFDISVLSGIAYLNSASGGGIEDDLYTVDLSTGAATLQGQIGPNGLNTFGISVAAVPEPSTYALLAIGIAAGAVMRRRRRKAASQG